MLTSAGALDWAVFAAVVLVTMVADYLVFGKGAHRVSFREATVRSIVWVGVGLAFTGWVYARMGSAQAIDYLVAYLVEKSLSVDNLFVFLVIFTYFSIGDQYQQRVLFWGILGAVVMRAVFILAGTALLNSFHWMIYVFGGFLVYTGVKLGLRREGSVEPEKNLALRFARRFLRTTEELRGQHFFVVENGVRYATPLFLVLIVVEFSDILFAVDSVPAVLAITNDVFVVYASNLLAVLGLRALYFMLAGMMSRFHYLDTGLAVILVFIGLKLGLSRFVKVPSLVSLGVIAGVLTISIVASLRRPAGPPSIPD